MGRELQACTRGD